MKVNKHPPPWRALDKKTLGGAERAMTLNVFLIAANKSLKRETKTKKQRRMEDA